MERNQWGHGAEDNSLHWGYVRCCQPAMTWRWTVKSGKGDEQQLVLRGNRWISRRQRGGSGGIVDEGFGEMRHGTQDGGGGTGDLRSAKKKTKTKQSWVEWRGSGLFYNLADVDSLGLHHWMRQRLCKSGKELKTAHHRIMLFQLSRPDVTATLMQQNWWCSEWRDWLGIKISC